MPITTVSLKYDRQPIEALQMGGELWLRGAQIVGPLGLQGTSGIDMIYARHRDEFTADEARVLTLPTDGGPQDVRVFSLRGARLLAFFARTAEAKAFRRWVLDVLDGRIRPRGVTAPVARPVSSDAKNALETAMTLIEPGHPAQAALREIIHTGVGLLDDAALTRHADAWAGAVELQRDVSREFRRVRTLAAQDGYSEDALKAELRRRKHVTGELALVFASPMDEADA